MRKFVIQMQLDLMQNPLTRSWQSLDLRGFPRGGNEIDKIPLTVIMEMLAHSFDLLFRSHRLGHLWSMEVSPKRSLRRELEPCDASDTETIVLPIDMSRCHANDTFMC